MESQDGGGAILTLCDKRGWGWGLADRVFADRVFADRVFANWRFPDLCWLINRLRVRKICGSCRPDQSQGRDSDD
jgi:hypothetical protein